MGADGELEITLASADDVQEGRRVVVRTPSAARTKAGVPVVAEEIPPQQKINEATVEAEQIGCVFNPEGSGEGAKREGCATAYDEGSSDTEAAFRMLSEPLADFLEVHHHGEESAHVDPHDEGEENSGERLECFR